MHSISFLQDLAVVMIVAGITTILFRLLKQPVVLGYIIAGMIIGPHTPPYSLIHDEHTINTLSELGVILLMFSLGLEFSLRKLKAVGAPALLAALMEIVLLFWAGYEIGSWFAWSTMDSIFLGAMLSMSSTTIIIKVLGDIGRMKQPFAQLVFGILIIEDILGIAMIALLSGIAMTGTLGVAEVGATLGKLGIFLAVALVAGLLAVPRLLGYVGRFKSNEMLIVTVLALCFGFSLLAAKLGYSVALGAFIIGAVVAEAREIHRIEILIEPVRDMFSAIFFVAIGLLIDPQMLVTYWRPILVITLAVALGKIVACSLGAFLGGKDPRTSLHVGMSLAQIGEFSFIIASLGVTLKVTSSFLYPVAVAVSAITTLLTPYFIRGADAATDMLHRIAPPRIVSILQLYTEWTGRPTGDRADRLARSLMWKWSAQMLLNAVLIAALFVVGSYVGNHPPAWLVNLTGGAHGMRTSIWLLAVFASLPFFMATAKKLQALGLLIAETRVTQERAGEHTAVIRSAVASVVPIAGSAALGFLVLILGATLLPPLNLLLVLLIPIGFVAWSMARSFNRVYTSAQAALLETLAEKPPHSQPPMTVESGLLIETDLETVDIAESSPVVGKMIRELGLRTKTGASIVAFERQGKRQVNPAPDEELRAGDKLLLLGDPQQLTAARSLLTAGGGA